MSRRILVAGAGGFIGGHLVSRLQAEGFRVRGVDLKPHEFGAQEADEFLLGDLRNRDFARHAVDGVDEIYQLAAEMGGAGYLFSGEHDAAVMHNSALVNLNMLGAAEEAGVTRVFYSSSACVYPEFKQFEHPHCAEDDAYPAQPDSEYGWEKLFSERLYLAFMRNAGIQVKIARFHNIFGPAGAWRGGREKAPAAICRKVAEAPDGGEIEIWGDGKQTRSFLYIGECIEAIRRLMASDFTGPVNVGSEEMITIDGLAEKVMEIAGKKLTIRHMPGPVGVRGRNSDNSLIRRHLGWEPSRPLREGLVETYYWIERQVTAAQRAGVVSRSAGAAASSRS